MSSSDSFIFASDEEIECVSNLTERSTVTKSIARKAAKTVAKDVIAKRRKEQELKQVSLTYNCVYFYTMFCTFKVISVIYFIYPGFLCVPNQVLYLCCGQQCIISVIKTELNSQILNTCIFTAKICDNAVINIDQFTFFS